MNATRVRMEVHAPCLTHLDDTTAHVKRASVDATVRKRQTCVWHLVHVTMVASAWEPPTLTNADAPLGMEVPTANKVRHHFHHK